MYFFSFIDSEIPLEQLTQQSKNEEQTKEVDPQEVYNSTNQENQQECQAAHDIIRQDISNDQPLPKEWRYNSDHPKDLIIGDSFKGVTSRTLLRNICNNFAFVSQIEPKNFKEAEHDDFYTLAMQEELN